MELKERPSGRSSVISPQLNNEWCRSLYEQKAAGLVLYGRALGLSHSEAEDVLQEVFMALLQLERQPLEPEHYCARAYRNRALNYRRGVWRRWMRELETARWFERDSRSSQAERAAVRCLMELPPAQREVIVLKIWNAMTFEAIGRLFDVSPNTVAGRYRYGLNKIKASLKDQAYERDEPMGETVAILDPASPLG